MTEDPDEIGAAGEPQVTVVLICFNDAERLPEAIASARDQTLEDIEIVIVDHGSTDGSVAVARAAADVDARIRVIALPDNDGKPGRPINAGMSAARAPWVTVFASDDLLRPKACATMLRTATEYSADIVIGSLNRVNVDTGETTRWMPSVSLRSRVITHVDQLPELIRDTTGGGKLFNTEFVRRNGLSFPEDIFYQDQVFTLEYFARAGTVAITSHFVLDWRHWPSGRPSVTQRKASVENLSDRFTANERIDEFLRSQDRADLLILKQRKFLTHDLSIHVRDLADATSEYRRALVERTRAYVETFPPESIEGLPLNKRLMLNCLLADRLDDAEQVTSSPFNRITATWARISEGDRLYVVPPWLPKQADPVFDVSFARLPSIPTRFRANRSDLSVTTTRSGFRFLLSVASYAPLDRDRTKDSRLVLMDAGLGTRLFVKLRRVRNSETPQWRGDVSLRDLDKTFGTTPGPIQLIAQFQRGTPGQWSVTVHPGTDEGDVTGTGWPWRAHIDESEVRLIREPQESPTPRPITPGRDLTEVLSLSDARIYLRELGAEPQPGTVFFESFAGRRIADGPLAVSRRLHERKRKARQYWSCSDWSLLDVPDYATPLPRLSIKYLNAMAESQLWIDNGYLIFHGRKGRRFVQLWHGSPVMRLPEKKGRPTWALVASSGDYFADCLLGSVPQDELPFLDIGAPRTDPLIAPGAARRRAELRRSWGVDDRTVVFFSPALRPGDVSPDFRTPDLRSIARQLGPEWFWFHREHDDDATGRRSGSIPDDLRWFATGASSRVDVTDYLLMADVLVSDYASVISDYALSGRPVVHYVPDQQFVEDVSPTTYFSLSERSAGPLVRTDSDLVAALVATRSGSAPSSSARSSRPFAELVAPLDARLSTDDLLDELGF